MPEPQTETVLIEIQGMRCASCTGAVSRSLLATPGVRQAEVVLADDSARVEFEGPACTTDTILEAVAAAGFEGHIADGRTLAEGPAEDAAAGVPALRRSFLVALTLSAPLPILMHGPFDPGWALWVQGALALAVQIGPGRTFYRSAWLSLRHRSPNMDALVVTGAVASLVFSLASLMGWFPDSPVFFESAALLITFVSLGKWLEGRARQSARTALRALLDLTPPTARRIDGGTETIVPATTLEAGHRVSVRAGETIPADGVIRSGETTVDESMLTGEATPIPKQIWDDVIGGSINEGAPIEVEVTATGTATVLAGIVRMVRAAQADTPPIQRLADRLSAVFVPIVIALAGGVGVAWWLAGATTTTAFIHATAVVVVACPCALGLATPTAILVGSGIALRHGILVRSGSALETLARVTHIFLDKTGTLTDGHFELQRVVPAAGSSNEEVLATAAALARHSTHPVAVAIAAAAPTAVRRGVVSVEEHRGLGLSGNSAEDERVAIAIGRRSFLRTRGVTIPEGTTNSPTEVGVARGNEWLGSIELRDRPRPGAAAVIADLRRAGVTPILLTGDRAGAAHGTADAVGIPASDVHAELLPGDKLQHVERCAAHGATTAVVGDGINDAPALAAADVGIAIGSGTDVAKETGAIVLVRSDLRDLLRARTLSAATLQRIRQNLGWAFIYNILALPIAAGVFAPDLVGAWGFSLRPEYAALAMALSSVSVVTNSLLLRRKEAGIFAAGSEQ
ncbi:MAG: heavy metal translocating P-type ATPase [Planctomycetota bacterium]